MGHLPFGYRIENGKPVIDDNQAMRVKEMYKAYLSGLSLTKAAEVAGLKLTHSSAKHMLRNRKYLGDGFYPPIIDKKTYELADEEISERAQKLGRSVKVPVKRADAVIHKDFSLGGIKKAEDDPFMQAEYVYSLIKAEESYGADQ